MNVPEPWTDRVTLLIRQSLASVGPPLTQRWLVEVQYVSSSSATPGEGGPVGAARRGLLPDDASSAPHHYGAARHQAGARNAVMSAGDMPSAARSPAGLMMTYGVVVARAIWLSL